VQVVATAPDGATATASFAWQILAASVTVANPGSQSNTVGNAVSLPISAIDNNGGTLSYSTTGLPPGLAINAATGTISGTVTTAGTFAASVLAQDGTAAQGSALFTWTVTSAPPGPAAAVDLTSPGNQTGAVGAAVSLQIKAADSDGGALGYQATGLPAGLSVNSADGLISGTPTKASVSTVTVTATDASGPASSATFKWTIGPAASAVHYSLSGVSKRRAKLSLTIAAATGSPSLETISIRLPKGLSILGKPKTLLKRIGLRSSTGKRLKFTASVNGGTLKIKLKTPAARVRITISNPVLAVTKSLARKVAHKHVKSLSLAVKTTSATNITTQLTLKARV
jgi:hypothetical protein